MAHTPKIGLVPLEQSEPGVAEAQSDHPRERESQDSDQLIHKSVQPQFTALGVKTDRSTHVRGSTRDHPGNQGPISQTSSQTSSVHSAQPKCDDKNTKADMAKRIQVLGTTKVKLERKDLKDQDRGTLNEVV